MGEGDLCGSGLKRLRVVLSVGMELYLAAPQALAVRLHGLRRRSALSVPVFDFRRELKRERRDALGFEPPAPGDVSSYFCTGGTTGSPKIARRTHASEAFDAGR